MGPEDQDVLQQFPRLANPPFPRREEKVATSASVSLEVTRVGECVRLESGHTSGMRVHVPVGVIEDTDGYLHAAEQRSSGPIALCGGGHIRERWGEDFDTDDPRSCPICVAILSG